MSYRSWCINVFIKALWINGEDQLINLSLTRARVVRRMWERDSRPWPATVCCRTLGEVQMKWLCRFPTSQWLNCSQSFKTSLLPSTPPAPPHSWLLGLVRVVRVVRVVRTDVVQCKWEVSQSHSCVVRPGPDLLGRTGSRRSSAGWTVSQSASRQKLFSPCRKIDLTRMSKLQSVLCSDTILTSPSSPAIIDFSRVSFRLEIEISVKSLMPCRSEVDLESREQERKREEKKSEVSFNGYSIIPPN